MRAVTSAHRDQDERGAATAGTRAARRVLAVNPPIPRKKRWVAPTLQLSNRPSRIASQTIGTLSSAACRMK